MPCFITPLEVALLAAAYVSFGPWMSAREQFGFKRALALPAGVWALTAVATVPLAVVLGGFGELVWRLDAKFKPQPQESPPPKRRRWRRVDIALQDIQ